MSNFNKKYLTKPLMNLKMKNTAIITIGCFCFQVSFAQTDTRKILHGQVVNDSIKVDNVLVFNINSNTGTAVDSEGSFNLKVQVNDTLFFSSLSFKNKKIVVTKKEISDKLLIIKMDAFVNKLDEVVVSNKKLKPKIANSQSIVDKKYFDDNQSSPKNRNVYDGTIENGVNFVRLFKDVLKLVKKKTDDGNNVEMPFTETVMQKINYGFYKNTLNLRDEEIRLFLLYCEKDPIDLKLFNSKTDFEIMDFLISKNIEFDKMKSEQK
jgi:hypothetical protein